MCTKFKDLSIYSGKADSKAIVGMNGTRARFVVSVEYVSMYVCVYVTISCIWMLVTSY